jgi:hypothetical protein
VLDFKCCAVLESKPVALPCEGKQVGPTEGRPGAFLASSASQQLRSVDSAYDTFPHFGRPARRMHGTELPSSRTLVSLAPREVDNYQPGHII